MKSHKDLEVWKRSIVVVTTIYELTSKFPDRENYGLTQQIRRCAVSVPSNISEGASRSSTKEYIRFINIALGSLAELETQLIIAENLNYCTDINNTYIEIDEIGKMLSGLKKYLKTKLS